MLKIEVDSWHNINVARNRISLLESYVKEARRYFLILKFENPQFSCWDFILFL